MNNLNHFVGKVCTILTHPVNRHFTDEAQYANTFVGFVEKVDDLGIWLIQLTTKKKSFFSFSYVVGIIEETLTVFASETEAEAVRSQLETRIPPKDENRLISVDHLNKLKKNNQEKKK